MPLRPYVLLGLPIGTWNTKYPLWAFESLDQVWNTSSISNKTQNEGIPRGGGGGVGVVERDTTPLAFWIFLNSMGKEHLQMWHVLNSHKCILLLRKEFGIYSKFR